MLLKFASYVFRMGNTIVALDQRTARAVHVKRRGAAQPA